ncbi:ribosomal RNA small subunit methyltransferase G [Gottschalkia purinilytica]|uniref:Ribosomal RNA small subunit methyltransferase G n=1 Tax=Gottschalkia purinilytica TaxID=1503 RepID=A0A0L0W6V5_GOTPU|nr:16S rRNA (guanine(527)-N(7))-methyltransferase RsmG [Gottschalkia purinilytica]KNF07288.1 ribosomal RNA small subunit methyltransferase G [Gottschalkia purinilytica]
MSNVDTLKSGIEELNISIDNEKIDKFNIYKELLKDWNDKINLTAITDDKEIDIKHFLDSISIFKTNKLQGSKKIIDIGTGGGFPGVPIKIVNEEAEVVLLDGLNKRLKFLDEVIDKLNLKGITTLHGRAEEYSRKEEYREVFDIAVSRAVASLNTLSEYCIPFVKVDGYFIAMKGPDVEEEIKGSKNAIKLLGGKIEDKIDIKLPHSDITHNLLVIRKISHTPTKYPRGGGKPKKKPL